MNQWIKGIKKIFSSDVNPVMVDQLILRIQEGFEQNSQSIYMFTSSVSQEGTTYTCLESAKELARKFQDLSIVIVDMNVIHPDISNHLQGVKEGWNQWVESSGKKSLSGIYHDFPEAGFNHIKVLPFHGNIKHDYGQINQLLAELKKHFNLVLLDMPSLEASPLLYSLVKHVTGVFYVVEAHNTRRQVIGACIRKIKEAGGIVTGVILNKRKYAIPNVIYSRVYK